MNKAVAPGYRHILFAIDDVSLPFKQNIGLYLNKPTVRPEPVLAPSPFGSGAADDLAAMFYGTVLHDGGKFRMWYNANHWGKNPDWPPLKMQQIAKPPHWYEGEENMTFQGPLCYAESDDGIVWTKPALRQVLFKGSRENNILDLPHTVISCALVVKDDAEPDASRRYKMVYEFFPNESDPPIDEYGTVTTIALAVSPDGLQWTPTGIPYRDQFVEPGSFLKLGDSYMIHYQTGGREFGEGGTPTGRMGRVKVSADFDRWPDFHADTFALPEPEDQRLRGISGAYDQVHLGIGAASFGNVCIGLYGLWHNANFGSGFEKISCDLGLVISNDGVHFREPVKGHRFLPREESPAPLVPGYNFNTILTQGNGILNIDDETRIYHGRWRNIGWYDQGSDVEKLFYTEIALAVLPRDRWGALALDPNKTEGTVRSDRMAWPTAAALVLNADGIAGLSVDLLDEQYRPIPGFTDGRCVGGGLDCPVGWPERDPAELAGRTVCIQVNLNRIGETSPRLYAVYLK